MLNTFIAQIKEKLPAMPPQQRKAGIYLCENPQILGLLTLTEFAERAGVAPATITRFCNTLGFDGFLEFSREVQGLLEKEISHVGLFRDSLLLSNSTAQNSLGQIAIEKDTVNLQRLYQNYPAEAIAKCVALMQKSNIFMVLGKMSAYPLAVYFEQLLAKVSKKLLVGSGSDVMQAAHIAHLDKNSMAFCIAFPRYPQQTIALAKQIKQRGAKIVSITNSEFSPLAPLSDILFTIDVSIVSYIDLFCPVMAFINALCIEFCNQQCAATEKSLSKYDKIVKEAFFIGKEKQ